MPKYKTATWPNGEDGWETVYYRDLRDKNVRARLRDKELRDRENGDVCLGVRYHEKTPHFFSKRAIRKNVETGVRESERHGMLIDKFLDFLANQTEKQKFGFCERPWDKQNKGFHDVCRVSSYQWGKEVAHALIHQQFIVFDLFGRARASLALLDSTPWVAVEVVDTHFHSKKAFECLLKPTKNMPAIVFYIFAEKHPYLNQEKMPKRKNMFAPVRVLHYIADGSFWETQFRIEEDPSVRITPDQIGEYYNLVKERIVSNGLIRSGN